MHRFVTVFMLAIVVFAGLVTFPPSRAFACSCVDSSIPQKLQDASAVFVGKVAHKGFSSFFTARETRQYAFKVERAWKGVATKRVTIQSIDGDASSCGTGFKRNHTYLVFAYQDEHKQLRTSLCSGNIPLTKADDAIAQLGKAEIEGAALADGNGEGDPSLNLFLYASAIVLVAAAGIYVWKIYRRKRWR
ncbi:hypothetical protein [Cohnella sp. GCM10012308]|uniref:hypothetical protein n=1 Tax=Cohnella sp. GCM10012308 TaxID=3317329 RepID=UPI003616F1A9